MPTVSESTRRAVWRRLRGIPFILMHLGALVGACVISPTWEAVGLGVALYVIRMFGITGVYHRYFAHRAYKTSRWFQFVLAWIGCTAMQKGPLWWAVHHRHHHKYSDQDEDPHSPVKRSVWWSHAGWVMSGLFRHPNYEEIKDFNKYPELRVMNKLYWGPGILLAAGCYLWMGMPGLVWGFLVSTVFLYHGTFLINSACHLWGTRRYETTDESKNLWWAAILTLGEGWHNNHHAFPRSYTHGMRWYEVDISAMIIRTLERLGLAWNVVRIDRESMERKAESLAKVGGGRQVAFAPQKPMAEKKRDRELSVVGITDVD